MGTEGWCACATGWWMFEGRLTTGDIGAGLVEGQESAPRRTLKLMEM